MAVVAKSVFFGFFFIICCIHILFAFELKAKLRSPLRCYASEAAFLLPDPAQNAIGNFFEKNIDDESATFIQCNMVALGSIGGKQYGVGFPIDMPVMLTYFDANELRPVHPTFPNYDHLVNHVAVQLSDSEIQLYKTPVVLTLQGDFEEEDMNSNFVRCSVDKMEEMTMEEALELANNDVDDEEDFDEDDDDDDDNDVDDDDVDDFDDGSDDEYTDDDEDDNSDGIDLGGVSTSGSFWNNSPAGKHTRDMDNIPDFAIYRPKIPNLTNIPEDAFVSTEDSRGLRLAHRKADKIIQVR